MYNGTSEKGTRSKLYITMPRHSSDELLMVETE